MKPVLWIGGILENEVKPTTIGLSNRLLDPSLGFFLHICSIVLILHLPCSPHWDFYTLCVYHLSPCDVWSLLTSVYSYSVCFHSQSSRLNHNVLFSFSSAKCKAHCTNTNTVLSSPKTFLTHRSRTTMVFIFKFELMNLKIIKPFQFSLFWFHVFSKAVCSFNISPLKGKLLYIQTRKCTHRDFSNSCFWVTTACSVCRSLGRKVSQIEHSCPLCVSFHLSPGLLSFHFLVPSGAANRIDSVVTTCASTCTLDNPDLDVTTKKITFCCHPQVNSFPSMASFI